jgi:hypothetical protein
LHTILDTAIAHATSIAVLNTCLIRARCITILNGYINRATGITVLNAPAANATPVVIVKLSYTEYRTIVALGISALLFPTEHTIRGVGRLTPRKTVSTISPRAFRPKGYAVSSLTIVLIALRRCPAPRSQKLYFRIEYDSFD